MKWLITFVVATLILWAILVHSIGMPFMKMVAGLTIDGTPMFIHTREEAVTVARWMLGITGLMAAVFGAEVAAIVTDWDRFIQRMLTHGRRWRY